MICNIQPSDAACLATAISCVMETTPNAIYEEIGVPKYEIIHIQQIIRYLLELGHHPVVLERYPHFDGQDPLDLPFWPYIKEGVLCTETHAFAYDGERIWNPNGRIEKKVDPWVALIW